MDKDPEILVLDLFGGVEEVDGKKLRPRIDWRGLHGAAVREELAAQAACRRAARVDALRAATPAPGTEVTLEESDQDAGAKTTWETRRARVESVGANTIILRALPGGYRVNVAWQDLLCGHIRLELPFAHKSELGQQSRGGGAVAVNGSRDRGASGVCVWVGEGQGWDHRRVHRGMCRRLRFLVGQ